MNVDNGTATFNVPVSLSANFPSGKFSTGLALPKVASFGVAYAPCNKFMLALDANMMGWKSFDTLAFDFEKNTSEVQDTKSAKLYKNTFSYRVGAQYALTGKLDARAGIKYLTTPVKDGYVSPDVPDASHFNYSVGFGYKFNTHFAADMSLTIQNMERTDTSIESQMNGTYKTSIVMPGVSINYNF